jgi:hypothetical protein
MPNTFKIKKVVLAQETHWVPDWPGLEDRAYAMDGAMSYEDTRNYLFGQVDQMFPGAFTLEYSIEEARANAFVKIDKRSDEYFAAGFEFQDIRFSLTLEAQTRMTAMMMLADKFEYPMGINSLDDNSILQLQNGDHTRGWCGTALYTVKQIVDSGTQQKDYIRNTQDVVAILNYEDPRPRPTIIAEPNQALPSSAPQPIGAIEPVAEPTLEPEPQPVEEPPVVVPVEEPTPSEETTPEPAPEPPAEEPAPEPMPEPEQPPAGEPPLPEQPSAEEPPAEPPTAPEEPPPAQEPEPTPEPAPEPPPEPTEEPPPEEEEEPVP